MNERARRAGMGLAIIGLVVAIVFLVMNLPAKAGDYQTNHKHKCETSYRVGDRGDTKCDSTTTTEATTTTSVPEETTTTIEDTTTTEETTTTTAPSTIIPEPIETLWGAGTACQDDGRVAIEVNFEAGIDHVVLFLEDPQFGQIDLSVPFTEPGVRYDDTHMAQTFTLDPVVEAGYIAVPSSITLITPICPEVEPTSTSTSTSTSTIPPTTTPTTIPTDSTLPFTGMPENAGMLGLFALAFLGLGGAALVTSSKMMREHEEALDDIR